MAEHQLEILAVRGKGYALKVGSRKVFHELFSSNNGMLTREDRIKFLIMKLARTSEWCDLLELEDDLFVSHTTLENDIREIRNRISEHEPYLTVLREGNRIRLDDDEVKRRNIMVRLYSENWIMIPETGSSWKISSCRRKLWTCSGEHGKISCAATIFLWMISA